MLPQRRLPIFLAAWVCTLVLGWVFVLPSLPAMGTAVIRIIFHPLTAEFLFGAISALIIRRTGLRTDLACCIIGCLALVSEVAAPAWGSPSVTRILLRGLAMMALVHGAVAVENNRGILLPRLLRKIGDASYSIYLSHILVISAIGRAWSFIAQPGLSDNVFVTALMFIAAVGFGLACYRFLEIPLLALAHERNRWRSSADESNQSSPSATHRGCQHDESEPSSS